MLLLLSWSLSRIVLVSGFALDTDGGSGDVEEDGKGAGEADGLFRFEC